MDQLSSEDRGFLPATFIGPMTRMGERLAANAAEIGNLKKDTENIRASIHDINNSLQISVAAERQCALALASLAEKMSSQSEMIDLKMSSHFDQITALSVDVKTLTEAKNQVQGAWWVCLKMFAALVAIESVAGAIITSIWWAIKNIKITS